MSMLGKIQKMRRDDWAALLKLAVTFVPGRLRGLVRPHVWVVSEYEMMARDNGYWFFKYLREAHPEVEAYYPISRRSPDFVKISPLGNLVEYGSMRHYMLFWSASVWCSSSSVQGFPWPRICEDLVLAGLHRFRYVFLNHGITRGYSHIVNGRHTNYDLLCTCSEFDRRVILEENDQRADVVQLTGFARHDNLDDTLVDRGLVVVMPTWREWLSYRNETTQAAIDEATGRFLSSSYFESLNGLLNSEELDSLLDRHEIRLVFYLHQYAQPYAPLFSSGSHRITIGTCVDNDVQTLLKRGALLVTDYSSVCYDFAYMHKPVIYYQFDRDEFEAKQYKSGPSFSYEENGFGKVCLTPEALLEALDDAAKNGFAMDGAYRRRVDDYFAFHDRQNCARVFESVQRLVGGNDA